MNLFVVNRRKGLNNEETGEHSADSPVYGTLVQSTSASDQVLLIEGNLNLMVKVIFVLDSSNDATGALVPSVLRPNQHARTV